MPIKSCDYQATPEAEHGAQKPNEEDNVPPTNLDFGVRNKIKEAQRRQRKLKKRTRKSPTETS